MENKTPWIHLVALLTLWLGLGISCSTTQHHTSEKDSHSLAGSSIDIQYFLGHDHYRFFAKVQGSAVIGNTSLNKQILEQGKIDENRYPEYLKKVSNFIREVQQTSQSLQTCRAPFTVIVKVGKETETARGCRATDGGALSRLVRDGEFLLYSKN
jgi:hypothetical protein